MIVFRCANAPVLWLVSAKRRGVVRQARCINDGAVLALTPTPTSAYVSALRAMVTHSVQLGGAIVETFEIDVDP